jgi:hypothetical protein
MVVGSDQSQCRPLCSAPLTPLYGLVRRVPRGRTAAATFAAREQPVVAGPDVPTTCRHMSPSGHPLNLPVIGSMNA